MDTPNENSQTSIYGILRYALVLILFIVIVRFAGGAIVFGIVLVIEYVTEQLDSDEQSETQTTAYQPDSYVPYSEETPPIIPPSETKTESQVLDDLETLFTALTVYYVLQKIDDAGRDGKVFSEYIELLEATRHYCETYAPSMTEYGIIRNVKEAGISDYIETVQNDPSFGPISLAYAFACYADIKKTEDFTFPTLKNPQLMEEIRNQLVNNGINETIVLTMVNEYERTYASNPY